MSRQLSSASSMHRLHNFLFENSAKVLLQTMDGEFPWRLLSSLMSNSLNAHLIHSFLSKPGSFKSSLGESKAYLTRCISDNISMAFRAMLAPNLPRRDVGYRAYEWAGEKPKNSKPKAENNQGITTTLHGLIICHNLQCFTNHEWWSRILSNSTDRHTDRSYVDSPSHMPLNLCTERCRADIQSRTYRICMKDDACCTDPEHSSPLNTWALFHFRPLWME